MKNYQLLVAGMFVFSSAFAQKHKNNDDWMNDPATVITCTEFHVTRPLSEIVKEHPVDENAVYEKSEADDHEHNKPQKFKFGPKDGPQYGNDPASLQGEMGGVPNKAPIQNWVGQTASGFRPFDPTGAAGPNHYVQMINSTTFKVFNKSTGAAMLTATLGNLWSPATANDGDPIVLYDKAADRWFLAQFNSANKMYIAISQTGDPTGSYYTYTFTSPDFPDYLKFSVWQDGYYMTGNYAQKVFAFDRTAMLAGSPTARSIYKTFSPPNAGYFFVPLTGDVSDGTLPASGTPCPIFSYSDNGWGTGYVDAVNIYQMAVNWTPSTPTATISSAASIPTAAFDGSYNSSWNDISQPGTTQKLDGIGGTLMFRAQYKTWSTYNSVVLSWAVKISTTQRSFKWCELRQTGSTWSMYQEGIYTPDSDSRWMSSIAMDNNGSIGVAYMKANSSSTYPGLYYTGRRSCDPLGTLPVTEAVAIAGTGSQTGMNRDGDYAHMCLDPDGTTFWYTGEYMGGSTGGSAAKTRIFSFQITPCASTPPVAAFSGTPTTICAGQSVSFTDLSTNTPTSWSWTFTGGTPSSSTSQNPTVVYNTPGTYSVSLTATNSGGSNTVTQTNYITVNAVPATPTASSNSPVCSGTTLNLTTPTVSGATYSWSGPGSYSASTQNPTRPSATTAMSGTYSVTVTVGGCTSAAGTTAVTVNATPSTPTASSNSPVCAGSTLSLTTATVSGATYHWSGPGSYTASTQNPNRPSATTAMSGTYSVTVTVGGCTSAAGTTAVTVNAIPATPTASSNSPVCSGTTLNLTTPTVSGATYSWSGPGSYSASTQNPTRPSATTAMSGTYSVTVTVGGCTSATGTTAVTVNATPSTPTASSNSPVCAGSTLSLTTATVSGATYHWSGPGSYTASTQNPNRPSATTAMSGTYSVTVTVGGCTSAAGTTAVTVNAIPATPTASSNSPVCSGTTLNLTTPTVSGATYSWSGPGSYSASTQNPTRPSATTAMSGTYSVTVTVGGCTSATGTTAVTVNATPSTPTASSNSPVCAGSTLSLTTATVSGATYHWSGPGSYTASTQNPNRPSATTAMSGTYSVTVTVGGCTSAAGTTAVTVNATPAAPTVTSNSPVCEGDIISLNASTISGASYSWTGPNTFSASTQNTSVSGATSAMAGTYSVTATVAGCTGAAGTTTVVVNPIPATPTITQSGLTLTSSSATGNQWYLNGVAIPGATSQNYTVTTNGNYTVVVTTGSCSSNASSVTPVTNVGIVESTNPYGLLVSPNPNDGHFIVSFRVATPTSFKLELYNALGQIVYREDLKDFIGDFTKSLNVTEYGKGTYTITLTNSNNESVKRIVVY